MAQVYTIWQKRLLCVSCALCVCVFDEWEYLLIDEFVDLLTRVLFVVVHINNEDHRIGHDALLSFFAYIRVRCCHLHLFY